MKLPVLSFQKTFHGFCPTSLTGPSRFWLLVVNISGWRGSPSTTASAFRRNRPRPPTLDLSLPLPASRLCIRRLCISIPVDSTVPRHILPAFDNTPIEIALFRHHLYFTQPNQALERTAYMRHGSCSELQLPRLISAVAQFGRWAVFWFSGKWKKGRDELLSRRVVVGGCFFGFAWPWRGFGHG
jgi:hypothetical protein